MPLPNFFIIGAQKCGTDALYYALKQHPEIYMSPEKEPSYFIMDGALPAFRLPSPGYTRRLIPDRDRYLKLFENVREEKAIGEASAIYLSSYHPERTARRICRLVPHAKIIALLRQPADRAYSAYQFYHAREIEPIGDFAQALAAESGRYDSECPDIRHRANGYYYANLKPYYDTFPWENIRVYLHEEWSANPEAVLRDIFRLLGIDENVPVTVERRNVTTRYRSKRLRRFVISPNRIERTIQRLVPTRILQRIHLWNELGKQPFSADLRRELTAGYQDDIQMLQQLIGKDLSHWTSGSESVSALQVVKDTP